jgi:hypothetical protein
MPCQPVLLPQVRVDEAELRTALHSVAVPGFTGTLCVEIGLAEETEDGQRRYYVVMAIRRRESKRTGDDSAGQQILPDVERRKPVEKVLAVLRPKLFLRPILQAVEFHLKDGVLQPNFTIQE